MKILVVGGGIIGCSLAYELTKAGCAVTLLERSTPGAEASSAAAGVLSPLAEATHAASSQLAVEAWDAADLRTREPAMSTNVRGAMFVKSDHWVNNQRLVVAYAQAAVAAGVALISGCAGHRRTAQRGDRAGPRPGGLADHPHVVRVSPVGTGRPADSRPVAGGSTICGSPPHTIARVFCWRRSPRSS